MPRTHKPYEATFRQQAVELLLTSGKPQREVARDLGISERIMGLRVRKHAISTKAFRPARTRA